MIYMREERLDIMHRVPRDEDGEGTRAKGRTKDAVHAATDMENETAIRAPAGSGEEKE